MPNQRTRCAAALAAVLLTALLWTGPRRRGLRGAPAGQRHADRGAHLHHHRHHDLLLHEPRLRVPRDPEGRQPRPPGIGSDGLCTRCGLREDGTAPAEPAAPAPIQAAVETPAEPPAEERPAEKLPAAPADRAQSQTVSAPAARTALLPWAVLVLTVLCASGALLLARRLRRG